MKAHRQNDYILVKIKFTATLASLFNHFLIYPAHLLW